MFEIREANELDLEGLLELYTELHDNAVPIIDNKIKKLWYDILKDKYHHIIIGCMENRIVASCVLIVVPNLTHGQRPYALIENVVTCAKYRNRGYATKILNTAKQIAENENCYKIMLLTGSKEESILRFYEKAGYNRQDKTAFIQWI